MTDIEVLESVERNAKINLLRQIVLANFRGELWGALNIAADHYDQATMDRYVFAVKAGVITPEKVS